ncbi:hypothetical protein IOC61_07770 [Halomonas sp. KAO]|nr:hypothetical protein [Halomonas sp. KAO]
MATLGLATRGLTTRGLTTNSLATRETVIEHRRGLATVWRQRCDGYVTVRLDPL